MPGLSPNDPRFEKAVHVAVALFWKQLHHNGLCHADLEDLAQELRIALLREGASYPIVVAKRRAIDWWRDLYGRVQEARGRCTVGRLQMECLMDLREYEDEVSTGPRPDAVLLSREVCAVLSRLSSEDRYLIVARYLKDLDMKEIEAKFGVGESMAFKLMARARASFKAAACWEGCGGDCNWCDRNPDGEPI